MAVSQRERDLEKVVNDLEVRVDQLDGELRHAEQVIGEKELVISRLRAKVGRLENLLQEGEAG